MFSRPNWKTIRKGVGLRLTIWYSSLFILSSVLLFAFSYFGISYSLKKRDREAIESKLTELASLYEIGGLGIVERESTVQKKFEKEKRFLVRVGGPSDKTLLLVLPTQWMELSIKELTRVSSGNNIVWTDLHNISGKKTFEVATIRLKDDRVLQVGRSTEDQERILGHFRENFLVITIPLVLLAFAGGAFVASRALRPIRHIISAVHSATNGKMDTRVPKTGTDDELGELVTLFNEMLERIETLIKAMKNSLDSVAHDLRTPMTRLRCIAEIALRSGEEPYACREALAECIEECERILKMLNTLMDISEAETGTIKLEMDSINVCKVLNDIGDAYRYVGEDRQISLDIQCEQDLWIMADPTRIYQIMSNLCENALKYTDPGGQICIRASGRNDEVLIAVMDTGLGISREDLPRIWERSYRCDESRSQSGLGLGLSLVKAFVQAHKGHVEVTSQPGKGSTFTISLPAAH